MDFSILQTELRQFSREYVFDAGLVFGLLTDRLNTSLEEKDKASIVSKSMKYYVEFLVNDVLGNKRVANTNLLEFNDELEFRYKFNSEEMESLFSTANNTLGNFIKGVLGWNITYITHEVTTTVDCYGSIFIRITPVVKTQEELTDVYLDNIVEDGGWVSPRLRSR